MGCCFSLLRRRPEERPLLDKSIGMRDLSAKSTADTTASNRGKFDEIQEDRRSEFVRGAHHNFFEASINRAGTVVSLEDTPLLLQVISTCSLSNWVDEALSGYETPEPSRQEVNLASFKLLKVNVRT